MADQAPGTIDVTADSVTGGPRHLACVRCGQLAWPLQEGQCQVCLRLDPAVPLHRHQHARARVTSDRRSFLGTLAALVVGARWLRPQPQVVMRFDPSPSRLAMGFSTSPPLHPNCRCVLTTTTPHPYLEPGDMIQLTLPDERSALFTLTSTSDHGRRLTLEGMYARATRTTAPGADVGRHRPLSAAHRDVGLT